MPYAMYLHDHTGTWQLSAKTQDASIEARHAVARGDREARDRVLYALDDTGLDFAADRSSLVALARDDPSGYLGIVRTNAGSLVIDIVNPVGGDQVLAWLLLPLPLWAPGIAAWRHRRSRVVRLMLALAVLPMATAVFLFFVQHRYLLVSAALASVLVGVGVATLERGPRRVVMTGVVVLLALSSVQAFHATGGGGGTPPTPPTSAGRASGSPRTATPTTGS